MQTTDTRTHIEEERRTWHRPELLKLVVQLDTGQELKQGSCVDGELAAGRPRVDGVCLAFG